jgi:hypothetical protein
MSERIQGVKEKVYKGVKYRSTLEADTAETLDKLGIPFVYEGRKITLLEGFYSPFQKKKVVGITYTPDFEVGNIIIECKGFETPEWRNKKKYIFKYLMDKEPQTLFYQTHNSCKDLLLVLDNYWEQLGYAIQVTSRGTARKPSVTNVYGSVAEAMEDLKIKNNIGPILKSMMGDREWVYNYKWKLIKISQLNN